MLDRYNKNGSVYRNRQPYFCLTALAEINLNLRWAKLYEGQVQTRLHLRDTSVEKSWWRVNAANSMLIIREKLI